MPMFSTPYDPPIPVTDIHDGSVSNAEFGYLNGVTSAIQTQIDGKAASSHTHDDRYFTETESDARFAAIGHNHSGVYEPAGTVTTHAAVTSGVHGITAFAATILDDSDAATVRGTIGLGSIATQSASSVAITGGTITGITDLAVADGGTGASSAPAARSNLGLGTAATRDVPASGNAASGEVVLGDDTRLTDSTLAALAAWGWSSGVEVPTFTAADTLSILRVGSSANNLVQLDGSGQLPAVSGALLTNLPSSGSTVVSAAISSNANIAGTSAAWVDSTLSVALTEGTWDFDGSKFNWFWGATGKNTQNRLKVTAGSITKTDGRVVGECRVGGGTSTQMTYTAATGVISGGSQSSGTNSVVFLMDGFVVVPSGGCTITLQYLTGPGSGETVVFEQGSCLKATKR